MSQPKNTTRLNINISEETARQLKELAAQKETSVTNIVRRATGVYHYLNAELAKPGTSLQIADRDTKTVTTLALL